MYEVADPVDCIITQVTPVGPRFVVQETGFEKSERDRHSAAPCFLQADFWPAITSV